MNSAKATTIGVAIVAYHSHDVIEACLDSLLVSDYANLRIAVVDNASPDDSVERIRAWADRHGVSFAEHGVAADGQSPVERTAKLTLLRSSENLGFAGGVNVGLKALLADPHVGLFWVLNPDCVVMPTAALAYAAKAEQVGAFGLMSGRTLYHDAPHRVQSDGARVSLWTGVCRNVNNGALPDEAAPPDVSTIDYFIGANVIASRAFLETVGLMPEEYFLYFEEVEWAIRRGGLPLVICPDAVVRHHAGTAIGSGSLENRPSGFANYFNFRNRLMFIRRNHPLGLPFGYVYSMLKIVKMLLYRDWDGARGAIFGLHALPPPPAIRAKLAPETAARAFGRAAV